MSVTLRNAAYSATVFEKGAELASLASVAKRREYIWIGDPAWWTGRAPILFPVVGCLKDGSYSHEGRRYSLPGHGFVRISDFAVVGRDETSAALRLESGPRTRESYPFDFALTVDFRLKSDGISIMYRVKNTGRARMLFSIGSHPGFMVPFADGTIDDYYVQFDQTERDERWFIKDNLIDAAHTERAFEGGRRIRLSKTVFDRGALVFKHPRSTGFSLRNDLNDHAVTVLTEGAPYLGIWAKAGAPYVCIEPWHGIADSTDSSGLLAEKDGILNLGTGESFETGYRIQIK